MKVLYFARFRQLIGRASEDVVLPADVVTVGDLLSHLTRTDNGCAAAFSNLKLVRAAVNQNHVGLDYSLKDATEVAFFPPVTGG
jgi:molybdopterin synthase sulfur carrier subunit